MVLSCLGQWGIYSRCYPTWLYLHPISVVPNQPTNVNSLLRYFIWGLTGWPPMLWLRWVLRYFEEALSVIPLLTTVYFSFICHGGGTWNEHKFTARNVMQPSFFFIKVNRTASLRRVLRLMQKSSSQCRLLASAGMVCPWPITEAMMLLLNHERGQKEARMTIMGPLRYPQPYLLLCLSLEQHW